MENPSVGNLSLNMCAPRAAGAPAGGAPATA